MALPCGARERPGTTAPTAPAAASAPQRARRSRRGLPTTAAPSGRPPPAPASGPPGGGRWPAAGDTAPPASPSGCAPQRTAAAARRRPPCRARTAIPPDRAGEGALEALAVCLQFRLVLARQRQAVLQVTAVESVVKVARGTLARRS